MVDPCAAITRRALVVVGSTPVYAGGLTVTAIVTRGAGTTRRRRVDEVASPAAEAVPVGEPVADEPVADESGLDAELDATGAPAREEARKLFSEFDDLDSAEHDPPSHTPVTPSSLDVDDLDDFVEESSEIPSELDLPEEPVRSATEIERELLRESPVPAPRRTPNTDDLDEIDDWRADG